MQGLVCEEMAAAAPATSVDEFLHSDRTCNFRSWYARGLVRVEMATLLMAVTPKPAVLITGGNSPTPAVDVSRFALSLLSGEEHVSCCECEHVRITSDGVSMPIPCEKVMAGQTTIDLLERRIDYHRRCGEWDEMLRLW